MSGCVTDEAELLDRLRAGIDEGRRLTGLRRLGGGHSNDTYLLLGLDLILRAPPAGPGLMPSYDVAREYHILRNLAVAHAGPPVPAVRALYDDSIIGRPFFLMARVEGESTDWLAPAWLAEPPDAFRAALSRRWCEAVASIHLAPPEVIPGPPRSPGEEAQLWLDLACDADGPAELLAVLQDLAGDPPRTSGPPTPVHGDVKFGNCLWTPDGTLTAMLDWEFSVVGEPLVDLGYLLALWPATANEPGQMPYTQLPGWWDRARFADHWQARTGRPIVDIDRYEQLAMAKIGTIFARGIALVRAGQSDDPRLARWERSLRVWLESMRRRARLAAERNARR